MTENPSSSVGRAAIDAYLDSVELALIAADAPRIDRLQVLQDLESQIADMLAGQPTTLTEESVRAVLDKLEPPSHFAATYASGPAATSSKPSRIAPLPRSRWPIIAAVSAAILVLGCLFGLLAINGGPNDLLISVTLLSWLVGFLLTPIALWMAYKQLRAQPGAPGRDLVLHSATVYSVIVPTLTLWFITAITEGLALVALGVAAFVYFEYQLIRRIWRYMSEKLPQQPASSSTRDTNGKGASAPVTSATPMPAI